MTEAPDPFFQAWLGDAQVIWATRPITLVSIGDQAPSPGDPALVARGDDGSVIVAGDRDLVVYGDEVTIRGTISVRKGTAVGAKGAAVTIVARRLLTDGVAVIDVGGAKGLTDQTKDWGISTPRAGTKGYEYTPNELNPVEVAKADETFWIMNDHHGWDGLGHGDPAGPGQTSDDPTTNDHDPASPLNGSSGAGGGDGGAGGSATLRIGQVHIGATLTVGAQGGRGGAGLKGQKGATGGAGGDGCDPQDWTNNHGEIVFAWKYYLTLPHPAGRPGRGGRGGQGGASGRGGDGGNVILAVRYGAGDTLDASNVAPGAWGNPGDGGDGGDTGAPGFNPQFWTMDKNFAGTPRWDKLAPYPTDPLPAPARKGDQGDDGSKVTPQPDAGKSTVMANCEVAAFLGDNVPYPMTGYLQMLLERVRDDLLLVGAGTPSDDLKDRMAWLGDLLDAYSPTDPREIDRLDALRGGAHLLGDRPGKRRLDYFGHTATFAPLGPMSFHESNFDTAVSTLSALQAAYGDALAQLSEHGSRSGQLIKAAAGFSAQAESASQAADTVQTDLAVLAARIVKDEAEVTDAKADVDVDAAALKDAVTAATGLSVADFFQAIGQFAFFGESPPQQAAMVISQLGTLANDATKCLGADGQHYNTTLVLAQIASVTDLDAAWTEFRTNGMIGGIRLADPGAKLLIGKQSQLDSLCDKLWNFDEAHALKTGFERYLAAMQQRNADILSYNEGVSAWQQYSVDAAHATAAAQVATDEAAGVQYPGLLTTAAQLGHMVDRAKDDCISELYLASRAYWFWSLKPGDELAKVLSDFSLGQPLALDAVMLNAAKSSIYEATATEIERRLSNPTSWLPDQDNHTARGIIVSLTETTHPKVLDALRTTGIARVWLPPARHAGDDTNAFDGLANVRCARVRAWVVGAKTSNDLLRVDLTHGGHEIIIEPDDTPFVVTHARVRVPFQYDLTKTIGTEEAIVMDARLTPDPTMKAAEPADPGTALIGPFAHWTIDLTEYNHDLDRSAISEVQLEFFCWTDTFTHDTAYKKLDDAAHTQAS